MSSIHNHFRTNANLISGADYFIRDKHLFIYNSSLNQKLSSTTFIEVISSTQKFGLSLGNTAVLIFNNSNNLNNVNFAALSTHKIIFKNINYNNFDDSNYQYPVYPSQQVSLFDCIGADLNFPPLLATNTIAILITGTSFGIINFTTPLPARTFDSNNATALLSVVDTYLPAISAPIYSGGTLTRFDANLLNFEISNCYISPSAFVDVLRYFVTTRIQYTLPTTVNSTMPFVSGNLIFKNLTGVNTQEYSNWYTYVRHVSSNQSLIPELTAASFANAPLEINRVFYNVILE